MNNQNQNEKDNIPDKILIKMLRALCELQNEKIKELNKQLNDLKTTIVC